MTCGSNVSHVPSTNVNLYPSPYSGSADPAPVEDSAAADAAEDVAAGDDDACESPESEPGDDDPLVDVDPEESSRSRTIPIIVLKDIPPNNRYGHACLFDPLSQPMRPEGSACTQ